MSEATLWGLDEKATQVIGEGIEVAVDKVHGWGLKFGGMGASIQVCGGVVSQRLVLD